MCLKVDVQIGLVINMLMLMTPHSGPRDCRRDLRMCLCIWLLHLSDMLSLTPPLLLPPRFLSRLASPINADAKSCIDELRENKLVNALKITSLDSEGGLHRC